MRELNILSRHRNGKMYIRLGCFVEGLEQRLDI